MTQRELCAIIEEVLETEPGRVTPETDLTTLDTFDSVSVLTLMILLDERAGIMLSPADAAQLAHVSDLIALGAKQGVVLTDS